MENNIESFEDARNHEKYKGRAGGELLTEEELLAGLRREIEEIRKAEMTDKESWLARGRKGKAYDPHFDEIDPQDLTSEDLELYEKFKKGKLSFEEMKVYQDRISKEIIDDFESPINKSRINFQAYLANKLLAASFDLKKAS